MTSLDISEVFCRIGASFPPDHRLSELAADLLRAGLAGATDTGGSSRASFPGPVAVRGNWPGELGTLGDEASVRDEAGGILLWLGAGAGESGEPRAPAQLLLSLPSGRYKTEYWAPRGLAPIGVEIGLGPALVLSPPCRGPLAALVRKIDKNGGAI